MASGRKEEREEEDQWGHMVHGRRCERIFREFLPLEIEVNAGTDRYFVRREGVCFLILIARTR